MDAGKISIAGLIILLLAAVPAAAGDADAQPDQSKSAFIVGRIEETADPEKPLPLKLTKLQAETPKMDTMPATVLHAGVTALEAEANQPSYPTSLKGYWGGSLTIVSEYHRGPGPGDPDRRQGNSGLVVFNFYQDGSVVKLKPATIFLPTSIRALKDCFMKPNVIESMEERSSGNGENLDPNKPMRRNPEIALGNVNWEKLDGSTNAAEVTANNLNVLGPDIYEQDIVTRRSGESALGRTTGGYTEVICRFKQTGPGTQLVQVAKITYGLNRSMLRRLVLEGTVTQDWQPYADKISKQLNRPWQQIVHNHHL